MSSNSSDKSESMRDKLLLLLVDKLVLAGILAFIAYFFSLQLQRQQLIGDYQKSLFENRLEAYESLLKEAEQARDECIIIFTDGNPNRNRISEDPLWQKRLTEARDKLSTFLTQAHARQRASAGLPPEEPSGGFGSSTSFSSLDALVEDALAELADVETIRKGNGLFLSETVNKAVDQFLVSLLTDINKELDRVISRTPSSIDYERAAVERIQAAYEEFRQAILKSLRIEEIVLG